MSFPRYPKYKASGVNELGDLPEHWDVKPLKHFAGIDSCGCYGVDAEEGEHVLPVATTAQIDSDGRFVVQDMPMRGFTPAEIRRYGCGDGDILVVKSSGSATNIISGKAGLVTKDTPPFVFSNFLMRIRPTNGVANPRFIYSLLRSHLTRQRVEQMCSTTTYPNLKVSEYTSAPLPIPPVAEQTKIASFLDRETSKIDGLVGEQRRLIELLKEKRQAVISRAVTKGLNPHAPLKPSGIEWLGDVPEHWEIRRLKTVSSFITSGPRGWSERIGEAGALFVQSGDLNDRLEVEFATAKRVQVDDDAESTRTRLCDGDVVVCVTGAKTGNVAVCSAVPEAAYVNQHVCLVRPTSDVLPLFLGVLLKSRLGQTYFEVSQYGLKQGLSLEDVKEAPVMLPSVDEQRRIIAYLDTETTKLDALTAEAEHGIELLQERRTALISAAVTGQIDVRELVSS
ncbi:MAG: restriction endonuclease subunit S [Planctomycetales bacterium]|nr:restriction endonuclease subunit S [Planctomycetales bacterium]